ESGVASSKHQRGTTMSYYAGIDVSLEASTVCVIDATGKIIREGKVPSGALQVDGSPGDTRHSDVAQAGSEDASRDRDEPARHVAQFRTQGRQGCGRAVRVSHSRAC